MAFPRESNGGKPVANANLAYQFLLVFLFRSEDVLNGKERVNRGRGRTCFLNRYVTLSSPALH